MKNRKYILLRISLKRHRYDLKRRYIKKRKRRIENEQNVQFKSYMHGDTSIQNIIAMTMSDSVKYLLEDPNSPLRLNLILIEKDDYNGEIAIPAIFSLIDNPKDSYGAIRRIVASLLYQKHKDVIIDYSNCKVFTLEAQVLLDLVLRDILKIYKRCERTKRNQLFVKNITDRSKGNSNVRKMLFSVGSQAIHTKNKKVYPDIIPYNLCVHQSKSDTLEQIEQKDLDTTSLSDYVENCLARMGRTLDGESMDDLCTVIGEILINAEEHSSTKCRYSIGYFEEKDVNGNKLGLFQLVILNIGRSIYEKFHDSDCPNKDVVEKMRNLSKRYTKKGFFTRKKFEEEALWTLYSLQDGVTSVSPKLYPQRGNGSLRFIESFLNLKRAEASDTISKMTLQSGSTCIVFDGSYDTSTREVNGDRYRIMAFNKNNDIEDIPDVRYVRTTEHFFPGTFICANIVL